MLSCSAALENRTDCYNVRIIDRFIGIHSILHYSSPSLPFSPLNTIISPSHFHLARFPSSFLLFLLLSSFFVQSFLPSLLSFPNALYFSYFPSDHAAQAGLPGTSIHGLQPLGVGQGSVAIRIEAKGIPFLLSATLSKPSYVTPSHERSESSIPRICRTFACLVI